VEGLLSRRIVLEKDPDDAEEYENIAVLSCVSERPGVDYS